MSSKKYVTVTTIAVADVTETWQYIVPADWQQPDGDEFDILTALENDPDATFDGVEDEVSNENDRQVESVEITDYVPDPEPQPQKVQVLTIEHKFGSDQFVYTTEDGALAHVARFVDEWWEQDGPKEPKPEDRDEKIGAYFEYNEREFYSISETEIRGDRP